MNPKRAAWLPLGVIYAVALVRAAELVPSFAGDAVIHFVLMENAAQGRWFEFNQGVVDAASTSLLWTLLGTLLFVALGVSKGLVVLKVLAYGALGWLGERTARLAQELGATPRVAWAFGGLAIALPGTTMNALMGMENGLFAALVVASLVGLASTRALARWLAALTATLAALTRPEGIWVLFVLVGWSVLRRDRLLRWAVGLGVVALLMAYGLHHAKTGHVVSSASVSRVMAARREATSLPLFGVWLYGGSLLRIALYAPLAVAAGAAIGRSRNNPLLRAAVLSMGGGLFMYTLVTGAAHTARYLIWIFALLCALAGAGLDRFGERTRALGIVWLACAATGETWLRKERLTEGYSYSMLAEAPSQRGERTDRLLSALHGDGCEDIPSALLFEVDERFLLDARVRVASLDGRTLGPGLRPLAFDGRGCPNLVLEGSFLLEPPLLRGCATVPSLDAFSRAWGSAGARVGDWVFDETVFGFVRRCPRGSKKGAPRQIP